MSSIAKKPRNVKRAKTSKTSSKPPRYTIRKDSLDRRYAIDKRTGKRIPIVKAEKERERRRKAAAIFRGIKSVKQQKPQKITKQETKLKQKHQKVTKQETKLKQKIKSIEAELRKAKTPKVPRPKQHRPKVVAGWGAHPISSKEWIQKLKQKEQKVKSFLLSKIRERPELAAEISKKIKEKQHEEEEEYLKQGFSKYAAELWAKTDDGVARALMDWRDHLLGPAQTLRGKKLDDRQILLDMIEVKDTRIMRFLKEAENLSLSPREAKTALFSPKASSIQL